MCDPLSLSDKRLYRTWMKKREEMDKLPMIDLNKAPLTSEKMILWLYICIYILCGVKCFDGSHPPRKKPTFWYET